MNDVALDLKKICVGQYELEVPTSFDMRFETAAINGFTIKNLGEMSDDQLKTLFNKRRRALEAGVLDDAVGEMNTLRWERIWDAAHVIAIDQSYDLPGVEVEGYPVEAYVLRDQIGMHLEGFVTFAEEDSRLKALRRVTSEMRAGAGPGFCFDGGHYPGVPSTGTATINLQDPEVERYSMTVSVSAGERAQSDQAQEGNASPTARPREIAGEPGYEVRIVSDEVSPHDVDVMIRFAARAGHAAAAGDPYAFVSLRLSKDAKSANAPPYDVAVSAHIWETALSSMKRRVQ